MKKESIGWHGLALVLFLILAACSGNELNAETEPIASESIEESTATPTEFKEEPTPTEKVSTQTPTAVPTVETVQPTPTEQAATEEPTPSGPRTGDIAPDFTLPDSDGDMVHLEDVLADNQRVILVFYHAYT